MKPPAPARRVVGHSLYRQLFLWLIVPQFVLWSGAAVFTYKLALSYANGQIDASLSTASRALARRIQPLDSGLLIDFPRAAQDVLESDPNDRLMYMVSSPPGKFILGNQHLPAVPLAASPNWGVPEFFDGEMAGEQRTTRVRQAALYLRMGSGSETEGPVLLVQVARSSANREELARRIFMDTLLPLSVLAALLTLFVGFGIRAGLAPLKTLRREVEGRDPDGLTPIALDAAPPEVRSLAEAVNVLLAKVRKSMEVQRRFIDDAAHQLRTPLAGLKSQTELALQAVQDPAVVARLQKVHRSATDSAHLVSQLLKLARAGPDGAATLAVEAVDVDQLCRQLTLDLVPRALAAGIDVGYEGPPAPAMLQARPLLLREALSNLVDNAIRYAGDGATVTVRLLVSAAALRIEVEDDGPGMPEADRARAFERFYRARPDAQGSGLGLAIVREIVLGHRGSVALEPVTPRGTVVRITLPRGQ